MFALQNALPAALPHILSRAFAFRRVLARLRALGVLHRQRQRLGEMDDHMLADIGMTRAAAQAEAARAPWDAPANWHQK